MSARDKFAAKTSLAVSSTGCVVWLLDKGDIGMVEGSRALHERSLS